MADPRDSIAPEDMRFFVNDKNYDEAKNRAVIEKTITDYEKMRSEKGRQYDDAYGERSQAVVMYLKHLDQGGKGSSNLMRYFGKRELARLRGDVIRQKLMQGLNVVRKP